MDKGLVSKIEALLFVYGEPLEIKKIAKILGFKEAAVREGLLGLAEVMKDEQRGLALIEDKDKVQLVTKPEFAKILEDITKQEFSEKLPPATLETLSIVAYAGPISRADIEYIRGVNSSFTLRALVMRGLVERQIDPKRSNAYIYSVSFELLRHLGLTKNLDLPEYQKYHDLTLQLHKELQAKDKPVNVDGQQPTPDVLNDNSQQP